MLVERILLKKGLRSDSIWVSKWTYRKPFMFIPIFLDTWALMRSQYWSREKIDALGLARLRAIVRGIKKYPLWKERFEEAGIDPANMTFEDLEKLPLLTKKDFQSRDIKNYTDPARLHLAYKDFTSGSTGSPLEHYVDFANELRCFAMNERIFLTAGAGKRYQVISIRSNFRLGFAVRRHFLFFTRAFSAIQYRLDEFIEYVKRFKKGFIVYGYTSWLIELARQLDERKLNLPVRAIIATGEGISEELRTFIEESLHTKFFHSYASRELGWIGYECDHKRIHLTEEWAYVEVVDERGVRLPNGAQGRIAVTTFDNYSMPFIRYEIGDYGAISDEPCPCGRTLKTISFLGRVVEYIDVGGGHMVSLLDIAPAFDRFPYTVSQFQIVQNGPFDFTMRVVPAAAFEKNRAWLHENLVRRLHPKVRIVWEIVEDIPRARTGKAIYFVRAQNVS
jgi:phenylacetate-CoA ligase